MPRPISEEADRKDEERSAEERKAAGGQLDLAKWWGLGEAIGGRMKTRQGEEHVGCAGDDGYGNGSGGPRLLQRQERVCQEDAAEGASEEVVARDSQSGPDGQAGGARDHRQVED